MRERTSHKEEIARRLVRAFETASVEEARRVCDPDVGLATLLDQIGRPPLHGHEGLLQWFARLGDLWGYVKLERWSYEEIAEWAVVTGASRVRGKASPDEFDLPWTAIARLGSNGLVNFLGIYLTREQALEAIVALDASDSVPADPSL